MYHGFPSQLDAAPRRHRENIRLKPASAGSAEEKEQRSLYSELSPDVLYPLKLSPRLCFQPSCGLNSRLYHYSKGRERLGYKCAGKSVALPPGIEEICIWLGCRLPESPTSSASPNVERKSFPSMHQTGSLLLDPSSCTALTCGHKPPSTLYMPRLRFDQKGLGWIKEQKRCNLRAFHKCQDKGQSLS